MSSDLVAAIVGGAIGIAGSVLGVFATYLITINHERRAAIRDFTERWRVVSKALEMYRSYFDTEAKYLMPLDESHLTHFHSQALLSTLPEIVAGRLMRFASLVHDLNTVIRRREDLKSTSFVSGTPSAAIQLAGYWLEMIDQLKAEALRVLEELNDAWIAVGPESHRKESRSLPRR
jgi:hypothetical protein